MTNKQAYQALDDARIHWSRKDDNHIIIWTPGYHHNDAHKIEKFLMQAKMRLLSREFDRICGKTADIYKHAKEHTS